MEGLQPLASSLGPLQLKEPKLPANQAPSPTSLEGALKEMAWLLRALQSQGQCTGLGSSRTAG